MFDSRRRSGFTILEGFMALGLLAFTWTAAVSLFPVSARALQNAHRHLMADRLCRRCLEDSIGRSHEGGFDSVTSAGPFSQTLTSTSRGHQETITFTYYVNVLTVAPSRLKDIESIVEWTDHGVSQRTSLKTPDRPPVTRQRGFSLAELLVYIVLLALLSMAVFQVFTMSVRYANAAQASSDLEASAQVSVQRLFDEVAQSSWRNVHVFDAPPAVVFVSSSTPQGPSALGPNGALVWQTWVCYYWSADTATLWRKQQAMSTPGPSPDLGDITPQTFADLPGRPMAHGVTQFQLARSTSPPMLTVSASFATTVKTSNDTTTQIVDGVTCRNP